MVTERELQQVYRGAGLGTNLYLRVKLRICPLLDIEPHVPRQGRVLDLGCGNGLFPLILSLGSSRRHIVGYDLDEKKLRVAQRLAKGRPGLEFHQGNIVKMSYPSADTITLIDVLYLLPFWDQDTVLRKCADVLRPSGTLLLKEMDVRPRWKYAWNYFQETVSVRIIGFTLGSRFFFRPKESFESLLSSLGFRVQTFPMDKGFWYPHILYVCEKR